MEDSNIIIGNKANQVSAGNWSWSLYVTCSCSNIKEISIHLHPTFKPNTYKLERTETGKYQSKTFTGWGAFNVQVEIKKSNGEINCYEHLLVFQEGGGQSEFNQDESMDVDEIKSLREMHKSERSDFQEKLSKTDFQEHVSPSFWHGRLFTGVEAESPKITWKSNLTPRNDHDAPEWLTASEYNDVSEVLEKKLEWLSQLLTLSNRTVIYTGAGISCAAGIGQAARGASGGDKKGLRGGLMALPTFTHYALGALAKSGYIHNWVQQNHDGLPQKAGFPQESINEIHGSWYDPSNPVVLYSGNLKSEQYPWMVKEANTADLVIVLGTSLGGLNADQVAIKTASRSRKNCDYQGGGALGTVIINLQQTQQDGKTSLRIFGNSDDVMRKLLEKLSIPTPALQPSNFKKDPRILVPYDSEGNRSTKFKMWLDLRKGARVKLTNGHNCQGAGQPAYLHIGAQKPVEYEGKMRKNGPGHGFVESYNDEIVGITLIIEGQSMVLGQWWIEAAARGGPMSLPVVNIDPEVIKA